LIQGRFFSNFSHINLHSAATAAAQIVMKKMVCGVHLFVIILLRERYTTKHGEVSRRLIFSA